VDEKPDLAVVHNLAPLLSLSLLKVLHKKNIPVLKRLENYKFLCLNGLFLLNNFHVCERCKNGNFLPGILRRCYQYSLLNSIGLALSEWYHRRFKTVTRNVDRFLATSNFLKSKYVEAGFPGNKIDVYPNFIDFDPLLTLPPMPAQGSYAVYIGRLSREKGLLTLLTAFSKLPGVPLKILGSGPLAGELKSVVHNQGMGNVEFMGYVDGQMKKEILSRAWFLIFPSECYESFGYPIIESMACGIPVIASDTGGTRELVTEGQTGFLFEPGNPPDLRQKISHLLSLSEKDLMDMKKNALARAKELYTADAGYLNIEKVFKQMDIDVQGRS
jgi:glycosyltransferase involved in cell wall biosynthesis